MHLFKRAVIVVFGVAFAAMGLSSPASADMSVDKMVVSFFPDKGKTEDIVVTNRGDEVLYVQVTPEQVTDSALPTEKRDVIRNPVEAGLLVSPRRIVLQPGDTQVVRLVKMRPFEEEAVFRVDLKPVVGELQAEQSGVKIMVGYNLIVFVAPDNMNVSLDTQRAGQKLTLINNGNVNIDFRNIVQCSDAALLDVADSQECLTLNANRLYPGRELTVDLPYDAPVKLRQYSGGKYETVVTQ